MFPQAARRDAMLDEISSGKMRVIDLSYAGRATKKSLKRK